MTATFLSAEWFQIVEALQEDLPANEKDQTINLTVVGGPDNERKVHITGSRFLDGHAHDPSLTIKLPFATAQGMFVQGQYSDAMPAVIAGKIQASGDITVLASIARSDSREMRELRNRLLQITTPVTDPSHSSRPLSAGPAVGRTRELAEIDRLGLANFARDLDLNGYAIVPPNVTGMQVEFIDRVRENVLALMTERTGTVPDEETGETHRNIYYSNQCYMLFELRILEELLLEPHALALASYLVGENCVLTSDHLFIKGPADSPEIGKLQLPLHSDHAGWSLPEPYPHPSEQFVVNCTWLLTDYSIEGGATVFVPGSHLLRRLSVGLEGEDRMVPVEAPKGSLLIWGGNTWHGGLPRTIPGLRIGLALTFTPPFIASQSPYVHDVTEEILARNPPRFAVLMGQSYLAGYRAEGPEALLAERAFAAAQRYNH